MTLARARVIRDAETETVRLPTAPATNLPLGRRIARVEAAALDRARQCIAAAEKRAENIISEAERRADSVRLSAEEIGRANGAASIASWASKLAQAEATADRRNLDRSVDLAKVLAHRLLGRALQLDDGIVGELAAGVLLEARGARRITFFTHPEDVDGLEQTLRSVAVEPDAVCVEGDAALGRGEFRLETDIGVLEAKLEPQLHRLAERLRHVLQP